MKFDVRGGEAEGADGASDLIARSGDAGHGVEQGRGEKKNGTVTGRKEIQAAVVTDQIRDVSNMLHDKSTQHRSG